MGDGAVTLTGEIIGAVEVRYGLVGDFGMKGVGVYVPAHGQALPLLLP